MKKQSFSLLAGLIIGSSPMLASADPILTGFSDLAIDANSSTYGSELISRNSHPNLADFFISNRAFNYQGTLINAASASQNGYVSAREIFQAPPIFLQSDILNDAPINGSIDGPSDFGILAPFTTSVDVSCSGCGSVYLGVSEDYSSIAYTWDGVAEAGSTSNARNTFQLVIIDRTEPGTPTEFVNDTPVTNDYDIEFRYGQLEWDGSSGDENDIGVAGIITDLNGVQDENLLPSSGTTGVAEELTTGSNVGEAGVWRFSFVDGQLTNSLDNILAEEPPVPQDPTSTGTGSGTSDDPFMPVEGASDLPGWFFDLVVAPEEIVFIDPDVAVGYDYFVDSGENFASVVLPTGFDDNAFELWLMTPDGWKLDQEITGGVEHFFAQDGVSQFRILGIDVDAMLDPADARAFVTGVSFEGNPLGGTQSQQVRQVAITEFVDDSATSVSEPSGLALMLIAMGGLVFVARRKKKLL